MSNNNKRIVVIGAQTAGLGAATAARKINRNASVTVLERSMNASSSPCGLPYFIGDEIQDINKLTFAQPNVIRDKMGIDLRLKHEVLSIDPNTKSLTCHDINADARYELQYDKLILGMGASPKVPPIDGIDSKGVFTLRSIDDATRIKDYIEKNSPRRAVVVGAGYIGLEMVEALARGGIEVTLVEMLPQILITLDSDIASIVRQRFEENGVKVMTRSPLKNVFCEADGRVSTVQAMGERLSTDLLILALGVTPNVQLARAAGIAIGECGAIITDKDQQTSAPDVFAAGDCCQAKCLVTGRDVYMPLATVAEKQGKIAGENAAGASSSFAGILGTSISGAFGLVFSSTGLTVQAAKKLDIRAAAQAYMGHSHAAYYPNSKPLRLKIVFDPSSGRLLGAQAVGDRGVVARINALVAAIHAGLSVNDLTQLDLPYAPPFGSSWDPIHIVAMMAARKIRAGS